MDFGSIWSFVGLEALLIACVLVAYLSWKTRRLRAQLVAAGCQGGVPALDVDSYSDLISKEILQTEAKLAGLSDQPDVKEALLRTVQTRLTFLRAEQETTSKFAENDDAFWARMTELLSAELLGSRDLDTAAPVDEEQANRIEALQKRIQVYEKRVSNLEQFKALFFAAKMKQVNSRDLQDKIRAEVDKAIPEQDQSAELKDVLSTLREENHSLEEQLNHIERELDDVLRAAGPVADQAPASGGAHSGKAHAHLEEDVENIRAVISQYKDHINELNGLVLNLKLDVKDKEQLKSYAEELKSQYEALQSAMQHLEEENDFLQEQISALLKQELEKEEQIKADAAEVKSKLDRQLEAYTELEGKYAAMEQSYLEAYEENQKLLAAAGSD